VTKRSTTIALLILAAVAALVAVVPASAQDQHPVPPATRFCGQGGSPAAPSNGVDARGTNPNAPNPLAGLPLYVNKINDPAYDQERSYQRQGHVAKAALVARIAERPRGVWFGRFTSPHFTEKVKNFLNCAQWMQPGSVPVMDVMRALGQQCNPHYTAGGAAEDARTRAWYRDFAAAVGNARVIIAYEPDSIGTISCLAKSRRKARLKLLRYGVDVLSQLPNATIYLEGSASDWKSPSYTARTLKKIGISKVRGFMVNVTHFDWTINNIRYGQKVSRKLGGKPFVVSTSYNGRGPVHYKTSKHGRRINVFCNVRYRGLGPVPTTNTGFKKVDAFLWLNRPGISGAGSCNGAPKNGAWWPARALMFAKYATSYLGPPRGTKFGFSKRISLCRLGAPVNGRYQRSAPEHRCKH
jgi:endoglucanase